jgi:hypothetical protein
MHTQSIGFSVAVGNADQSIIGPNARRQALIICAPATGRLSLNFSGPAVLDSGITLHASTNPIILTHDDLGSMIGNDVRAIESGAGGVAIAFTEITRLE